MEGQELNLSGIWRSRYEYGENQQGEHEVKLHQEGDTVTGRSLPDPTGSELTMDLKLYPKRNLLKGEWREKTSPSEDYRGQIFEGFLILILNNKASKATGKWLGENRDNSKVNSGVWILEKISGENAEI